MTAYYLDASAVVKRYADEPGSTWIRSITDAQALIMTPEGFERFRLHEPRLAMLFVLDLGRVLSIRFRIYNRRLATLGKL